MDREIDLPVVEIETVANEPNTSRVRLKGQWPEDEFLITVKTDERILKTVHDTKKRGGTVWLRLTVRNGNELEPTVRLVVRDLLE